jgi:hypothetical protein
MVFYDITDYLPSKRKANCPFSQTITRYFFLRFSADGATMFRKANLAYSLLCETLSEEEDMTTVVAIPLTVVFLSAVSLSVSAGNGSCLPVMAMFDGYKLELGFWK